MNDADFDKYYRKGGEYVLPTKIFNDLLSAFRELQSKEKNLIKYLEDNIYSIQPKGCGINFFPEDGYDSEEDMIRANVKYNLLKSYQDILERVKSGKCECK